MALWQQYAVHAWPTLVLVDPRGLRRRPGRRRGPGQRPGRGAGRARSPSTSDAAPCAAASRTPPASGATGGATLRFPAKAIVAARRAHRPRDRLVAGRRRRPPPARRARPRRRDRAAPASVSRRRGAPFVEPNGLALLPPELAAIGTTCSSPTPRPTRCAASACATVRSSRPLDLAAALAGASTVTGPVPPCRRRGTSPGGRRSAGSWSPRPACTCCWPSTRAAGAVDILAGTTVEGLRDGPAADAWLAQPSGLAVDGDRLWFVDAETSALRRLRSARRRRTACSGPPSARACSTSATSTARPRGAAAAPARRGRAARRLARRSRTPTTVRCAATTPAPAS